MGITDTIRGAFGGTSAPAGKRVRAVWRGAVLAESTQTIVVERNHYFPRHTLNAELLEPTTPRRRRAPPTSRTMAAFWKGDRVEPKL